MCGTIGAYNVKVLLHIKRTCIYGIQSYTSPILIEVKPNCLLKTFKMITIKVTEIIQIPTQLDKVELPLLTYLQLSTLDFVIQTLLHRKLHQPSHQ